MTRKEPSEMAEQHDVTALRRSPAAHLVHLLDRLDEPQEWPVSLGERAFVTMVNVRAQPASAPAERLAAALGVALPWQCGVVANTERHAVLWQGPDEWLVVSSEEPAVLLRELRTAVGPGPGSVVDVSANRTVLELTGPRARDVLEKGCAIDLHPRSFAAPKAVSTQVGQVPVVLWQTDDDPTYRLLPRASFADHLVRWLLDAMLEYRTAEAS
jgi:sarcosine oxidase, subunit gamma